MPNVYPNESGLADVPIGGVGDIVRTGELFSRSYTHLVDGEPRDWSGFEVESAIVYDPVSLTPIRAIDVAFPGDGVLALSIQDADVPAFGQYEYRVRLRTIATGNLLTVQDGRFTIGNSPGATVPPFVPAMFPAIYPYEISTAIVIPDGHWLIWVNPQLVGDGSITIEGDGSLVTL